MSALEELERIAQDPHGYAGGLTPQDITEPYIYAMYCPWCCDCLAPGLMGKYSYLEAVSAKSYMHMQQAFDAWIREIPRPFAHFISMPVNPEADRDYLLTELRMFKEKLADWIGRKIPEEELARAIEVYNENRRLLYHIYDLRRPQLRHGHGQEGKQPISEIRSHQA